MFDLILRQARLVDDTVIDIALKDGKIAALGKITNDDVTNGEANHQAGYQRCRKVCYREDKARPQQQCRNAA